MEDGYGKISAADLYPRCHAVLFKNRAAIEEFTCADDAVIAQVLSELGGGCTAGLNVINVGTDAHMVEGLRHRVFQLKDLALITMQRPGAKGFIQMC